MSKIWVEFHDITVTPKRWPRQVIFPGISVATEIQASFPKYYVLDMAFYQFAIRMVVDVRHDNETYQKYLEIFDNRGVDKDAFGVRRGDCSGATVHFTDDKEQYYDFGKDTDWYNFYNEVSLAVALQDV